MSKKKLVVGFDIDGCMNSIKKDLLTYGAKFFKGKNIRMNPYAYYFQDMFPQATAEDYNFFWSTYGSMLYYSPPIRGVQHCIHELWKNGINTIIITGRNPLRVFSGETLETITKKWLKYYDLEMPVFFSQKKENIVSQEQCMFFVEDKPSNIENLQRVTKVIIFKQPYNVNLDGIRGSSWIEIEKFILHEASILDLEIHYFSS